MHHSHDVCYACDKEGVQQYVYAVDCSKLQGVPKKTQKV